MLASVAKALDDAGTIFNYSFSFIVNKLIY